MSVLTHLPPDLFQRIRHDQDALGLVVLGVVLAGALIYGGIRGALVGIPTFPMKNSDCICRRSESPFWFWCLLATYVFFDLLLFYCAIRDVMPA